MIRSLKYAKNLDESKITKEYVVQLKTSTLQRRNQIEKENSDKGNYWRALADMTERYGEGACPELSAVGFKYGREHFPDTNVEIYKIKGGGHVLLVVGRDKSSLPDDYSSWETPTVICDTWADEYFPVSQMTNSLRDYKGTKPPLNWEALTEPFCPETQSLSCVLSAFK